MLCKGSNSRLVILLGLLKSNVMSKENGIVPRKYLIISGVGILFILMVAAISVYYVNDSYKYAITRFYLEKVGKNVLEHYRERGKVSGVDVATIHTRVRDQWGNKLITQVSGEGFELISLGKDNRVGGGGFGTDIVVRGDFKSQQLETESARYKP